MKTIATFVRVPTKAEVVVTQEDRKNFMTSVLNALPFFKDYKLESLQVKFSSPSFNIFEKDVDVEELFYDCLEEVCIFNDEGKRQVIYRKNPDYSSSERKRVLESIPQKSPLFFILVGFFYHFAFLFQKLVEECLAPDFFGTVSTGH